MFVRAKFQFHFVKYRAKSPHRFPQFVGRLGPKVIEYTTALVDLSEAGCKEAKIALRLLVREAKRNRTHTIRTARKNLECEDFTPPINLDPGGRWKADAFGLLALELLLWLWQARQNPKDYPIYGEYAVRLASYHRESTQEWWYWARIVMTDFYHKPQRLPNLRRLVTPPSYKGDSAKERTYIVRKIRERFHRFALPEPGYR